MRGLLEAHGDLVERVVMLDLSRVLLGRQQRALNPWKDRVSCVLGDALEVLPAICAVDLSHQRDDR